MASNEQSITLLRRNKVAQVEALRAHGFPLDEGARAADFAMYVRWAAGLLDVTIAANRISDNRHFFFTLDEWQSLEYTEQSRFLLRGVRVRAEGLSFVIAAETLPARPLSGKLTVEDAYSPINDSTAQTWCDSYAETLRIRDFYEGRSSDSVAGAPAAEAALNYMAYSEEGDGLADDSKWHLGSPRHYCICYRYRDAINAVLTGVWGTQGALPNAQIWTCLQYGSSDQYYVHPNIGRMYTTAKTNATDCVVRPISLT